MTSLLGMCCPMENVDGKYERDDSGHDTLVISKEKDAQ